MKTIISRGREIKIFLLLLSISILNNLSLNAQEEILCATENASSLADVPDFLDYSQNIEDMSSLEPLVLNVYFWQLLEPNGSYGGITFTEEKLLESIAALNIFYNQYKIYFKYRGYESVLTPNNLPRQERVWNEVTQEYECITIQGEFDPDGYGHINRCQAGSFFSWASSSGYRRNDAVNIYVPYGAGFGGVASSVISNRTVLPFNNLVTPTATHELGHNLGLYHTRSKHNGSSNKEHNTRDEYLPNGDLNLDFNARTADDNVVDTAANTTYLYFDANGQITYPYVTADCEYELNDIEKDELGFAYTYITELDIRNTMSNAYECLTDYLTTGQAYRMRDKIQNITTLSNTLTEVASLYEPYTGSYPTYYPHPLPWEYPLFQPGFNYRFVECQCDCNDIDTEGLPVPYDYTNFNSTYTSILTIGKYETDYSLISHPNHSAIQIDLGFLLGEYAIPRRCYDNWNSPPIIGGDVVKFNDNVFNNNVTITPQDSTSINNPNLINELQPGLYNIIKTDVNGNNQETVILKENE